MAQVIVGLPFANACFGGRGLRVFGDSLSSRTVKAPKSSAPSDPDREKAAMGARAALYTEAQPRPDGADPFSTLGVSERASRSEIKSVYRRLALQYHPDVCVGDDCALMFTTINQAYEQVMNYFHRSGDQEAADDCLEGFYGVGDEAWEDWEEWMGWEGASGVRDYSSHINMNL